MQFGLGRLRLPPLHFWAMTPRELSSAVQAFFPLESAPLTMADMDRLMLRFPDFDHFKTEALS